jgi:hypothetical protein
VRLRKYLTGLLLASTIFCGLGLVVWHARQTISSDKKRDDFSGVTYGYGIKQYYFWSSSDLTFWLDRGAHRQFEANFYFSGYTIEKVEDERWLSNGSVIYLNMTVKSHDTMKAVGSLKMIYDFHRGEMYTSSRFTMFRFWNERKSHEAWLSDSEFAAVLARYGSGNGR